MLPPRSSLQRAIIQGLHGQSGTDTQALRFLKVETLNSNMQIKIYRYNVSAPNVLELSIGAGYRGFFFISDSAHAKCGLYSLAATTSSSVSVKAFVAADDISFDVTTAGKLIMTPGAGNRSIAVITITGTII